MSQVIVTDDKLKNKRQESRSQEQRITQDTRLAKWKLSGSTGTKDPLGMIIGVALLPVLAAWTALLAMMMLMLTFVRYFLKGLGMIIGGDRNLITKP